MLFSCPVGIISLFRLATGVQGQHETGWKVEPHGGIRRRVFRLRCDKPGQAQLRVLGPRTSVYAGSFALGSPCRRFGHGRFIVTLRCALGPRDPCEFAFIAKVQGHAARGNRCWRPGARMGLAEHSQRESRASKGLRRWVEQQERGKLARQPCQANTSPPVWSEGHPLRPRADLLVGLCFHHLSSSVPRAQVRCVPAGL